MTGVLSAGAGRGLLRWGSSSLLRDPPHPLGPRRVESAERDPENRDARAGGRIIWFGSSESTAYETAFPLNCLQLFSVRKGEFFDL